MSTFVPIPRNGLRKPVEMSGMTSSRESASVQRSWRTLLEAQENVAAGHNSQSILAGKLRTIQPSNPSLMYPFKIYQLPWQFRTATNPATDWLKVRVRSGNLMQQGVGLIAPVSGTDGAPNPEIETYNDTPLTYGDIPVTSNTSNFYIWVNYGASTANIYFGTSASGANIVTTSAPWYMAMADTWPTFPVPDSSHIPIAKIDSMTHANKKQLLITQFIQTDIFINGGGGTGVQGIPLRLVRYWLNYWVGSNISNSNNVIQVAKPFTLRNAISARTIYGVSAFYTYPNSVSNSDPYYSVVRVANFGNGPTYEAQVVVPAFISGDIFYAIPNVSTNVISEAGDNISNNGTNITWLDLNVDGRAWARAYNQGI